MFKGTLLHVRLFMREFVADHTTTDHFDVCDQRDHVLDTVALCYN